MGNGAARLDVSLVMGYGTITAGKPVEPAPGHPRPEED